MSTKTYYINSTLAKYDDVEFSWIQSLLFNEGIIGDPAGALGMATTENTVPDMNVKVGIGRSLVEVTIAGRTFKVIVETDAIETLAIASNSSGSNRVDAIIIRVDKDTEPNTLKTNIATIEVVAGSGITALTDGAIDTAVGNDGWYRLADVTVPDSATQIDNADITDTRIKVGSNAAVTLSDPSNPSLTNRDVTTGGTDQEHTGSGTSIAVGEADTAGNNAKVAQSFIPLDDGIKGVELFKKSDTGTFTGNVVITLEADTGGEPTGVALATQTILNADWLLIPDATEFAIDFIAQYEGLSANTTYWIVVTPSTNDNANHPNIGGAGGDAYTDGGLFTENTTDGWGAIASTDLYFKTLEVTINQVVKTDITGKIRSVLTGKITLYTADTTWVKPIGLSYIIVEAIGASGGSGGMSTSGNGTGGGSGAGAYVKKLYLASELKSREDIVIGVKGTKGAVSGSIALQEGTDGTATTFAGLSAGGGEGGRGASQTQSVGGFGGVATGGDINIDGGDGHNGQIGSGMGGSNPLGIGGKSLVGGDSVGLIGKGYGAGSSGGHTTGGAGRAGEDGLDGAVIITEF